MLQNETETAEEPLRKTFNFIFGSILAKLTFFLSLFLFLNNSTFQDGVNMKICAPQKKIIIICYYMLEPACIQSKPVH